MSRTFSLNTCGCVLVAALVLAFGAAMTTGAGVARAACKTDGYTVGYNGNSPNVQKADDSCSDLNQYNDAANSYFIGYYSSTPSNWIEGARKCYYVPANSTTALVTDVATSTWFHSLQCGSSQYTGAAGLAY